jgi:outer membrane protein OmpA-like peptidoglycan-associated protein
MAQAESERLTRENNAQMSAFLAEADRVRRETNARTAAAGVEADHLKAANDARAAAAGVEADRLKAESDARTAAAGVEADRLKAANDARTAAAGVEADRLKAESDARETAARTEAERVKRENDAQRAADQAKLDLAARQQAKAETEKIQLRAQLLKQFNDVLQTRDTARGLIVNMSDVLFDTGQHSLRSPAREKLAKVAGIISGHPGLRLDVEGHTDSVGGDDYNQQLSERRGAAVRDYLTQQGIAPGSVTSKGLGKTHNASMAAEGRQRNRQVELVISGG